MSNSSKLFTLKQFNNMHHKKKMSLHQIAEHYNTYVNKVRRHANKLGANIRNKSDAQKVALETGRQTHPTKGKQHSEEVKIKISETLAEIWEDMPQKEKRRRSKLAKKQWENMSNADKIKMQKKANAKLREAAKHGSKLEIAILEHLVKQGYDVIFHKKHLIGNEKMHVDLIIEDGIAIEIDGPSHFKPIWGHDKLIQSQNADRKKDGILLNYGFDIIRIRQQKELTKKLLRDILYQLDEILAGPARSHPKKFVIGE